MTRSFAVAAALAAIVLMAARTETLAQATAPDKVNVFGGDFSYSEAVTPEDWPKDIGAQKLAQQLVERVRADLTAKEEKEAQPLFDKAKKLIEDLKVQTERIAKTQPDANSTNTKLALEILRKDPQWYDLSLAFDDNYWRLKEFHPKRNQPHNSEVQTTQPDPPDCPIGVIDIQQVQKDLGLDQQVQQLMDRARGDLKARAEKEAEPELAKRAGMEFDLRTAVTRIVTTHPEAATDKEILKRDPPWVKMAMEYDQNTAELKALDQKYANMLQGYARDLDNTWREALRPALRAVAKERGVKLILAKQNTPWWSDELDLTAAITEYMKKNPPPAFPAVP